MKILTQMILLLFGVFGARCLYGLGVVSADEIRGKTAKELIELRRKRLDKLNGILDDPQGKDDQGETTGDLTTEQREQHDELETDIKELDKRIDTLEKRAEQQRRQDELERRSRAPHSAGVPDPNSGRSQSERRDVGRFSLGRALRGAATGQPLDGVEGEMAEEGATEAREAGIAIQSNAIMISSIAFRQEGDDIERRAGEHVAGTATAGGNLVETNVGSLLDALMERLAFSRLGADVNIGLVGNFQINRIVRQAAGSRPTQKSEIASADKTTITFQPTNLTPNRLPTFADISKQLFLQATERNLERRVSRHIQSELRVAMEKKYITDLLAASGIGSVVGGANGSKPTYADIVNIAGAIRDANADPDLVRYLINTAVESYLMTAALTVDGSDNPVDSAKILPAGSSRLAGRPFETSNVVPSDLDKGTSTGVASAIIAGDFTGFTIAQWSGIEFIVDPFTQAQTGMNRVHAAVYHDGAVNDPAKFSAMQDALTS